jgi:CTP synthase
MRLWWLAAMCIFILHTACQRVSLPPITYGLFIGSCCAAVVQIAVIEYARNVLGIKDANSTEFEPATANPVVVFMPEISTKHMGGTMRLGARRTVLQSMSCISAKLYQREQFIDERHRHR